MPIFSERTAIRETDDGVCGPVTMLRFGDSGGLTRCGAFVEVLPPGSRSSIRHWHSAEDEMVYMLEGEATLHEGDTVTVLRPGEAATFRAGDPAGHRIENRTGQDLRYLVIGTRAETDTITYPDHDRILHLDRTAGTRTWTDSAGRPASNPYAG